MAMSAVNATTTGAPPLPCDLHAALARLAPQSAVTILIHGFRFCPSNPAHDPHDHILSPAPRHAHWKAVSWPRHLHLAGAQEGLGIAYGWPARGTLTRVASRALAVGRGLGAFLGEIHALRPDLRFNLFAHSLGVRVALRAIAHAPEGSVARAVLLNGAAYRDEARRALASRGGRAAEILGVQSGANAAFDAAFALCVAPARPGDRVLSAGLAAHPRWTDLPIDCARSRAAMQRMGWRIAPPSARVCHWSPYLRPGLFPLYRAVLGTGRDRAGNPLPLAPLRAALRDATPGHRFAPPVPSMPGSLSAAFPLAPAPCRPDVFCVIRPRPDPLAGFPPTGSATAGF